MLCAHALARARAEIADADALNVGDTGLVAGACADVADREADLAAAGAGSGVVARSAMPAGGARVAREGAPIVTERSVREGEGSDGEALVGEAAALAEAGARMATPEGGDRRDSECGERHERPRAEAEVEARGCDAAADARAASKAGANPCARATSAPLLTASDPTLAEIAARFEQPLRLEAYEPAPVYDQGVLGDGPAEEGAGAAEGAGALDPSASEGSRPAAGRGAPLENATAAPRPQRAPQSMARFDPRSGAAGTIVDEPEPTAIPAAVQSADFGCATSNGSEKTSARSGRVRAAMVSCTNPREPGEFDLAHRAAEEYAAAAAREAVAAARVAEGDCALARAAAHGAGTAAGSNMEVEDARRAFKEEAAVVASERLRDSVGDDDSDHEGKAAGVAPSCEPTEEESAGSPASPGGDPAGLAESELEMLVLSPDDLELPRPTPMVRFSGVPDARVPAPAPAEVDAGGGGRVQETDMVDLLVALGEMDA